VRAAEKQLAISEINCNIKKQHNSQSLIANCGRSSAHTIVPASKIVQSENVLEDRDA